MSKKKGELMEMLKFTMIILATITIISGCAMQEKICETPSGRPEVAINSTNVDLVKSAIINEMQTGNFFLSDDSNYRLAFTKQLEGGQAVMTQLAIGNSYSTTPVAEICFNISKIGNQIKVVEFSSISTQMAFGQVNRMDMKNNNAWFNDFQSLLQRVQARVESQ